MKVKELIYSICLIALLMPMMVNAQIYKWKDKNGVMRYSDTPPPPNVQVNVLGNTGKDTLVKPKAIEPTDEPKPNAVQGEIAPVKTEAPVVDPKIEAVKKAQKDELNKKNKALEEERAKIKAQNCKTAKANYQTYAQGGRIYKFDENGERVYASNDSLEAGKAQAQAEINKYCN